MHALDRERMLPGTKDGPLRIKLWVALWQIWLRIGGLVVKNGVICNPPDPVFGADQILKVAIGVSLGLFKLAQEAGIIAGALIV